MPLSGDGAKQVSTNIVQIAPLPGCQVEFLSNGADICVFGGQAGPGKTACLIIEPLRHVANAGFGGVIFRRTVKQITDEGGLWDKSLEFYGVTGAKPNSSGRYWTFKGGATIGFAGCELDADVYNYQGSEICYLAFDELTHFTEFQFFYLLSRNRSTCGVKPYVRATTNPDANSWVKKFLAPWVDRTFPDPARSGEIRWMKRINNRIEWVDEGTEGAISVSYVRGYLDQNTALLGKDPGYKTRLQQLPEVERKRLLDGDWDSRPENLVISSFDVSKNVTENRAWPAEWVTEVGGDFGKLNTAFVVVKEEPDTKRLFVTGEVWPGHSLPYKEMADQVKEVAGVTIRGGAGGNSTGEQGWREAYRLHGIPMTEPDNRFKDPALQYQNVDDGFREGWLVVSDACPKLIEMLGRFEHDKDKSGMTLDTFDDAPFHLLAALRYIVTKLRPPKSVRPKFGVR